MSEPIESETAAARRASDPSAVEVLQLRSLHSAIQRSFTSSVLSITVFSILLAFVSPARLGVWLAVRIVASALALLWLRHLDDPMTPPASMRRSLTIVMGVSGVIWGLVPLIVADQPTQWYAIAGLWIFGNQSVVTTVCSADRTVFAAAVGTVTIVGTATIAASGESFALAIAVIVLLGGTYAVSVFTTTHRTVCESFEVQIKARALSDELAARTVELEHANSVLTHFAHHDQLTDLLNRRAIVDRLTDGDGRSTRDLWIGLADLDQFKAINDEFGHATGDAVLIEVARRWSDALSDDAILGRIGGDEFIIAASINPEYGLDQIVAALTQALIEPISVADTDVEITVSSSVGFARVRAGDDLTVGLAAADAAMYEIKRSQHRVATL